MKTPVYLDPATEYALDAYRRAQKLATGKMITRQRAAIDVLGKALAELPFDARIVSAAELSLRVELLEREVFQKPCP